MDWALVPQAAELPERSGEATFQRYPFFPIVVSQDFDALIWIQTSTPSAMLF